MPNPSHAKPKRLYGDVVAPAKDRVHFVPAVPSVPDKTLKVPLSSFDTAEAGRIHSNARLIFHSVGDTGGVRGEDWQQAVANAMVADFTFDATGHVQDSPNNPSFFYHLGDVVYWNGLLSDYPSQFYEPYKFYPTLIFAIPGNHDGETAQRYATDPPDPYPTLAGFRATFVTDTALPRGTYRDTVPQPYFYWTLETELVTIIGLYGNVDGTLDESPGGLQQAYLVDQLTTASTTKPIIITVHQPPYSLDDEHGGYPDVLNAIDHAATTASRWPNLVLSGHVHNYQRYTRISGAVAIPYIVAGNGGIATTHAQVHKLTRQAPDIPVPAPLQTNEDGVSLRAYNEYNPGFMLLTVDAASIKVQYFEIDIDNTVNAAEFDSITIDWRQFTVTENLGNPIRAA